jgi:hypothetical protein
MDRPTNISEIALKHLKKCFFALKDKDVIQVNDIVVISENDKTSMIEIATLTKSCCLINKTWKPNMPIYRKL